MRLAWTVATPDTADTTMLAWRGDLPRVFSELAALGYAGVDLMVRDPAALDAAAVDRALRDAGLAVAAVSTGQLRKEDGLQLNAADLRARQAAVERSMAVVDFAARWGAQVNIGTLRGQIGPNAPKELAAESMRAIIEHARPCGVAVAVEPQCRWVSNWLNTAQETVEWLRSCTSEPRILFDLYHGWLEETSVFATLIRSRPFLTYVQVSDSNRLAPGLGSIHFGDVVRVLRALAYDGFVCVECRQAPTSRAAATAAAKQLIPLLEEMY